MNIPFPAFQAAVQARQAVKIIAGIANFDTAHVLSVAQAAEAGGAHAIDVAAQADIVRAVRQHTSLTVFASSVEPAALADAVAAGAHVAELGNFDALYDQGLFLSAEDVLQLATETVQQVAGQAWVSVTVPGHLNQETQVRLAQQLEALGVQLIQTEGAARVLSAEPTVKRLSPAEQEALTLTNTRALATATSVPVMTASGMTADNVALAFEAGASAVGVGTYVKQGGSTQEMAQRVASVMTRRARVMAHVS